MDTVLDLSVSNRALEHSNSLYIADPAAQLDRFASLDVGLEDQVAKIALVDIDFEEAVGVEAHEIEELIFNALPEGLEVTEPEQPSALIQLTEDRPAVRTILEKYSVVPTGYAGPVALRALAAGYIKETELDDTFYIYDLGNLVRLHKAWVHALPRVTPFYAVKCNPESAIVETLAALGCGFDCASEAELKLVQQFVSDTGRIIFAHPCKRPTDIRYAAAEKINLTTFDCVAELEKIAEYHPQCELVLRIRSDDPMARVCLGVKYGANPEEVEPLLKQAKALGLKVRGVSFHVGSGAKNPEAFNLAITAARKAFDMATAIGFTMNLLDLGGGFFGRFDSGGQVLSMMGELPATINAALDKHFPPTTGVQIIAEPGRYFAEAQAALVCHVHGWRERKERDITVMDYWISDGLYGSLNNIIYDHAVPSAWLLLNPNLPPLEEEERSLFPSTVFGPTCDGLDCVFKNVLLPGLRTGDWLLFPYFGAYSIAGATDFNGIQAAHPHKFYIFSETGVDEETNAVVYSIEMKTKPSAIVADG